MKVLVTAKRVPDPNSAIKVKPDGSGIVTDGLKYVVNPFDENAKKGAEAAFQEQVKIAGANPMQVAANIWQRKASTGAV